MSSMIVRWPCSIRCWIHPKGSYSSGCSSHPARLGASNAWLYGRYDEKVMDWIWIKWLTFSDATWHQPNGILRWVKHYHLIYSELSIRNRHEQFVDFFFASRRQTSSELHDFCDFMPGAVLPSCGVSSFPVELWRKTCLCMSRTVILFSCRFFFLSVFLGHESSEPPRNNFKASQVMGHKDVLCGEGQHVLICVVWLRMERCEVEM